MSFLRNDRNVGGRVLRSAAFLAGARLIVRLFSLLNLIVLARLLSPTDFGVAALAFTAIWFLQSFSDLKMHNALIALDVLDRSHLNTAFTLDLIRGMTIATLLFVGAGPIAHFMEEPALEPVLRVMSVMLIVDGLKNPGFVVYERDIDYSREFRRQTAATVIASLSGIAAAVYFRSYWAIVIASIVERIMHLAGTYWRIPHRPWFGLSDWRSFIGFNTWLSLQGMVSRLTTMASRILIGKFLGTGAVGVYTVASQLASLPTHELMVPLRRVLFPALSSIKDDPERLRKGYRTGQATILGLALPISLGLAFFAEEVILVLFGAQWLEAALPLRILAPVLAFGTLSAATDSLAMALREVRPLFVRSAIVLVIAYPGVYIGLELDGLRGATLGVAAYLLIATLLNIVMVARLTSDTAFAPLIASYRSLVAGGLMLGGLSLIAPAFDPSRNALEQAALLAPCVVAGAVTYAVIHYLLWRIAGGPEGFEENLLFHAGRVGRRLARKRRG